MAKLIIFRSYVRLPQGRFRYCPLFNLAGGFNFSQRRKAQNQDWHRPLWTWAIPSRECTNLRPAPGNPYVHIMYNRLCLGCRVHILTTLWLYIIYQYIIMFYNIHNCISIYQCIYRSLHIPVYDISMVWGVLFIFPLPGYLASSIPQPTDPAMDWVGKPCLPP